MSSHMIHEPTRAEPARERDGPAGTGRAFGSFGELVQGVLPDGDRHFLVTLPIDCWTTARFRYLPDEPDIQVWPPAKRKSRRLARLALDAAGRRGGGELEVISGLPEGKGMASSSADLVATARAVATALDMSFGEPAVEALLRRIEPSDGVMYDGVVAFYHREVRLHSRLGVLPPVVIIGHDEGGQVDTIKHNRIPRRFSAEDKREHRKLLAAVGDAVGAGELAEVGRAATRSTTLNARLRPPGYLELLRRTCADIDGLGLVLAHSGTMLGILLDGGDPELASKTEHVRSACAPLGGDVSVHRSLPHRSGQDTGG
nr:kinase [Kibdelosporangium sp. MJ126-NF4]CEL13328.1 Threonine kinase in B12 biosynthesis [Kibdelosporangium sp. MJ126-NF4]CTQ99019.1 Threonine kinase in B12 biosynthesis [Kibdelosporangium sp. MJ126-NF4]